MFFHSCARRSFTLAAALGWMACAGCGDKPTDPTPVDPPPSISCPAAQTATSIAGDSVDVSYPAPTTSGGTAPVTVTCSPVSGARFPVGSTPVSCTATDARQQKASCTFAVEVVRPPRLNATRFLAFGDSLTAGALGASCPIGGGVSCAAPTLASGFRVLDFGTRRAIGEETPAAYPRVLTSMLSARYAAQTFTIANEGNPSEPVSEGRERLADTLNRQSPEVLLLLQGTVDTTQSSPSANAIVANLRAMIQLARSRGIVVFVGTLPPERPNACRAYDFCDGVDDVARTNVLIRAMVPAEGATLVDLYQGFEGQLSTYLALDGLHPNEAGYQKIAELFFSAIRARLEAP